MIVGMSIRGSNDNMIALLVLVSVFLLLKKRYVLAGLFYGLSIHFKIYPIIYCFVFFFFIDCDRKTIAESGSTARAMWSHKGCGFLTKNRLIFTLMTIISLTGLTMLYFWMYEWEFLYEALIYHITRRDNRHNESVYWYMIYQLFDLPNTNEFSILMFIP